MNVHWHGVMPAITTPFKENFSIDHEFLAGHAQWLVENGCTGIVALGSLGESATLSNAEKADVLNTCIDAVGDLVPVVAGISSLSSADAVEVAQMAQRAGCSGLMVLPPYVYLGDWCETKAHVGAILSATGLSCMLYNNPLAYRVDFLPEQVRELLSEHPNLHAIKESSADVRRVTALRSLAGDRLQILCGVDDLIVEAVQAGAVGWIAGLVNAYPKESVELFNFTLNSRSQDVFHLYRWFLPLLRFDTVPKFVQLIKLVQQEVGMGSKRVRPPRLELTGDELNYAQEVIATAKRTHHASVISQPA